MTATSTEIETIVDDLTAHEFEPPCELGTWNGRSVSEGHSCERPARWIMFRRPCCAATQRPALSCDECKDARLMSFAAVQCGGCGHVEAPARAAYTRIEPL